MSDSYHEQAYVSRKLAASASEKNFGQSASRIERFDESKYEHKKSEGRLHSANKSKKVKGIKQFQKASMENYGQYAKSLYRSIDQMNLQRAQSARPVKIKGLKYQFKLIDLGKYHDTTKYGVFNWPVQYCTIGKKIPNPVERKNALVKEIHFDTLLRVLKQTDWAQAPLF